MKPFGLAEMKVKAFIFLILFFLLPCPVSAEEITAEPKNRIVVIEEQSQFNLAQGFFHEEDYFRAITEYKRFIFFFPNSSLLEMAYFKVGEAEYKRKRWNDAIDAFHKLKEKFPEGDLVERSYFLSGMSYFHQKNYSYSRKYFKKVIEITEQKELLNNARLQIALGWIEEEKWQKALDSIEEIEEESSLRGFADTIASGINEIENLPLKSPGIAGTLAAVVPGSGHFYTGRTKDGIIAFLINGAFIWGAVESYNNENYALAGILTFFEVGWYLGNIYSAVGSAHKYNKQMKDRYIRNIYNKHSFSFHIDPVQKSFYLNYCFRF